VKAVLNIKGYKKYQTGRSDNSAQSRKGFSILNLSYKESFFLERGVNYVMI